MWSSAGEPTAGRWTAVRAGDPSQNGGGWAVEAAFLIGAAIPTAVWAVAWFLENVVDPGCGDDPYFGCIASYVLVPLFALVAAVVGGVMAAAITNRALWWHRPLALIAGLGVATVVLVALAFWPKPVEWRPDPMEWFVRHLLVVLLALGIPALLAYGVVTRLHWLSMRWSTRRDHAMAPAAATDPAADASVSPDRFWDGTRWVDGAGTTDGRPGRGR